MDAQGILRFLGPAGDTGRVTSVNPGTASRRSMFAVSPDDSRIAVIVDDFNSSGAFMRLYVEDLNGGANHVELFTEVAFIDNSGTSFTIGASTIAGMFASGWIDDGHVMSGGDAQHQPRVATVSSGALVPVAAQGDCGGRIPGGL